MATIDQDSADTLLRTFYTVPRMGQERLSDGGGPFGFDITTALQTDALMRAYGCDGIVETGCFRGDTTEFLSRAYPDLPVLTCDLDHVSAATTRLRLRDRQNVEVYHGDSAELLPHMLRRLKKPLVYLDAHWNTRWPLREELAAVQHGIVAIDDFDIGHQRFSYDHYDGIVCGPDLVSAALADVQDLYIGNPYATYPFPCLQTGRRSGTGFLARGLDPLPMAQSQMFIRVPVRPNVIMPHWDIYEPRTRTNRTCATVPPQGAGI